MKRTLAIALIVLAVGGCSAVPSWMGGGMSISRISIAAEPEANNNIAIAVDLVMISDADAQASILKLTAQDWFNRRAAFLRDYPDGVKVQSWEIVPGQVLRDADVDSPGGMTGAVVFARYDSDGDHRLRLTGNSDVHLLLGTDDVRVAP